jgi:hypothetical protein
MFYSDATLPLWRCSYNSYSIALSPYAKLDRGKYSIEKSEMKIK